MNKARLAAIAVLMISLSIFLIACDGQPTKPENIIITPSDSVTQGDSVTQVLTFDAAALHNLYPSRPDNTPVVLLGTVAPLWSNNYESGINLGTFGNLANLSYTRQAKVGDVLTVAIDVGGIIIEYLYVDGIELTFVVHDKLGVNDSYYGHLYCQYTVAGENQITQGNNLSQVYSLTIKYYGSTGLLYDQAFPPFIESNCTYGRRVMMVQNGDHATYTFRVLGVTNSYPWPYNMYGLAVTVNGQAPYLRTLGVKANDMATSYNIYLSSTWSLDGVSMNSTGGVYQ